MASGSGEALSRRLCRLGYVPAVALCLQFAAIPASAQIQQYVHDEAGNIVEIRRLAAGEFAILQFAPARGPIGTIVTIQGQGFNASPGGNTVKFNGVAATLVGGSTTQLTATVPLGATSGPISVSNGSAAVASARSFTVTVGPSIAGFAPSIGAPGTPVTVSGANFDPLPINDRLSFGGVVALVGNATTSSLAATVPGGASSGRISLSTPLGSAISASDFFVPPGTFTAASVGYSGRMTVAGPVLPVSIPAGKIGLVLFDGSLGDTVTVYLESLAYSGSSVPVALYGANNALLASDLASTGQPWIRLPALPSTGTFALLLNGTSGTVSASLRASLAPNLAIGGSALATTLSTAGQPRRLAFTAIAGQTLGFGFTSPLMTPASGFFTIELLRPAATVLQTGSCYLNGDYCSLNLTVPATGTYSVWIKPPAGATGSLQTWATADLSASLVAGVPYTLSTTRAGQNARLAVAGIAGPAPAIEFAATTSSPPGQTFSVSVFKPDGVLLASNSVYPTGTTWTLPSFPVTGTYTLFVEPRPDYKGAATISTARVTLETGSAVTIDGAPATGSFATAGESARFTFSGSAGQQLGLGITALSLTPASAYASVTVYKPDGATLQTEYCYTNGDACSGNIALPVSGLYSVVVQPTSSATGAVSLWLSSNVTATLTPGVPYTVVTTRPGQNARLSFSGAAGSVQAIEVTSIVTNPAAQPLQGVVYKPDGTVLLSGLSFGPHGTGVLPELPVSGTYSLLLEPRPSYKGAATITAARVTLEPGAALTVGGASASATFAVAGDSALFKFPATAGQRLGLGFTGVTLTTSYADFTVFRPNGTVLVSGYCYPNGDYCAGNVTIGVSGQHSVLLNPVSGGTGSAQAWLTADLSGILSIGTATTIATTRSGQNASYTFSGTAGQLLRLSVSAIAASPAAQTLDLKVFKPDGTALVTGGTATIPYALDLPALPVSGTYSVFIEPRFYGKGAATFTVTTLLALR